jgi:predicted dehydrogenase
MNTARFRVGLIGTKGPTKAKTAPYWHRPELMITGVADIRKEYLKSFKENVNPDCFITTDYRELVKRDDIDIIVVNTPDFCHEEQTVAALEAGKHVFCEKPMAITIEGCDHMIAVSRKTGRKLMIRFNLRYALFVRKMKELVEAGAIGEIKAIWIRHFVGMGSFYYFHDWHANQKNTTSLLLQKGSHDIDAMHFVSGRYTKKVAAFGGLDFFGGNKPDDLRCPACAERKHCIDRAAANERPYRTYCAFRKEIDVPDNHVCIMELEGGIKAAYTECHFTPDYHRNFTFIGTEGRIENNELENKVWLWKRKHEERKTPDETFDLGPGSFAPGHGGADNRIADAFVKAMLENKEMPVPPEAGRMSVAVGVLAQKSIQEGGALQVIPEIRF